MAQSLKTIKREVRRRRIRAKVSGTEAQPRLSIFKSNRFVFAQIIDDTKGKTLVSSNGNAQKAKNKTEQAVLVGKDIATKAMAQGIKKVVFDRGGYIFTGRVKAVAESAREAGLEF